MEQKQDSLFLKTAVPQKKLPFSPSESLRSLHQLDGGVKSKTVTEPKMDSCRTLSTSALSRSLPERHRTFIVTDPDAWRRTHNRLRLNLSKPEGTSLTTLQARQNNISSSVADRLGQVYDIQKKFAAKSLKTKVCGGSHLNVRETKNNLGTSANKETAESPPKKVKSTAPVFLADLKIDNKTYLILDSCGNKFKRPSEADGERDQGKVIEETQVPLPALISKESKVALKDPPEQEMTDLIGDSKGNELKLTHQADRERDHGKVNGKRQVPLPASLSKETRVPPVDLPELNKTDLSRDVNGKRPIIEFFHVEKTISCKRKIKSKTKVSRSSHSVGHGYRRNSGEKPCGRRSRKSVLPSPLCEVYHHCNKHEAAEAAIPSNKFFKSAFIKCLLSSVLLIAMIFVLYLVISYIS